MLKLSKNAIRKYLRYGVFPQDLSLEDVIVLRLIDKKRISEAEMRTFCRIVGCVPSAEDRVDSRGYDNRSFIQTLEYSHIYRAYYMEFAVELEPTFSDITKQYETELSLECMSFIYANEDKVVKLSQLQKYADELSYFIEYTKAGKYEVSYRGFKFSTRKCNSDSINF